MPVITMTSYRIAQIGSLDFNPADWNAYNARIMLAGKSTVLGYPTPTDPTPKNRDDGSVSGMQYSTTIVTDVPPGLPSTARSLRLLSQSGTLSTGSQVVHGPYVVSKNPAMLSAGQTVEFWWKAAGGSDAYDIYGYLLDINTGYTLELINGTGANASTTTAWAKTSKTIPAGRSGTYHFVFISGAWDETGGKALGASLYIAGVNVVG